MLEPLSPCRVFDLNMVPPVEDSAPPSDTLHFVRSTATRDYQISLIESRGPNSRGVHMLRVGLVCIAKLMSLNR